MTGSALDRVEALLDPARVAAPPRRAHGYLDVLAPDEGKPTGISNAAMQIPALAAVYQKVWRPAFTRLFSFGGSDTLTQHDLLLDDLASAGPERILDVACGPGLYTKPLARKLTGEGLAVGIDVSDPMLRRAVTDNSDERVAYVRGSALALPFDDATFDTVVCLAALYLIPQPHRAVSEICRVTAPGGRVAVFTSLRTGITSVLGSPRAERISGFRWFGRDEITGWLRAEGLRDVTQTISGQGQFVTARQPVR